MKDLGRVSLFWEEVWSRWVRDERRGARTVHAGLRATRAYPSAAPAHTVSWSPRMGRMAGILSSAPTSHISVVPGLAKATSTPPSASARRSASSSVAGASSRDGARARRGRDGRGGHLLPMVRRCGRSARVGVRRSAPRAVPRRERSPRGELHVATLRLLCASSTTKPSSPRLHDLQDAVLYHERQRGGEHHPRHAAEENGQRREELADARAAIRHDATRGHASRGSAAAPLRVVGMVRSSRARAQPRRLPVCSC